MKRGMPGLIWVLLNGCGQLILSIGSKMLRRLSASGYTINGGRDIVKMIV
jgi:hypothetical protein